MACWGWVPKGTLKALEGLQNSALRAAAGPGDGEHAAHAGLREVFQLHPMEVRRNALAAKFACAMVHTGHRYEGRQKVMAAFVGCRHAMFIKRSVLRQAFRAVGELGLDWETVGDLGKERLDAVVKTAARKEAQRQWGVEAAKLSSLALMVQLKREGWPKELWEMLQGGRVAGDATEPVLGLVCGVCRVVPSVRAHYLPRKGVAPGMTTAGCDLCRAVGLVVARWEHVFDGSCPTWRPIVAMWVARMQAWYVAAGWMGAARGQGGWVALFGCAAPPPWRRGVGQMQARGGRQGAVAALRDSLGQAGWDARGAVAELAGGRRKAGAGRKRARAGDAAVG